MLSHLAKLASKLLIPSNERRLRPYYAKVIAINELEKEISHLSDDSLANKTSEFKERINNGETLDDLLVPAFAVVREVARRTLGMRPFDVQLLGGMILHKGCVAEMKTGEGKTLAAVLPVYLNALSGKGVHVVTVNDYLARRDSNTMSAIYKFLGLSTGVVFHDLSDDKRRAAYACDITYITNNELGFDYLRDNMQYRRVDMVQRGHNFAIVDEVDSIFIDEARTPLIISGPVEDHSDLYRTIDSIIIQLHPSDYEIDEKQRTVHFSEKGTERIEELLHGENLLKSGGLYSFENVAIVHLINNALKSHTLFLRNRDYIVNRDEVVIIDEFTGRMMPGRRYSDGQHQALEAKERVKIQPENQTLSSITFQNYFLKYRKLSGMTGTASTEAEELANIYNLDVIEVPTNVPVIRIDEHDEIYRTSEEKYAAIIAEIIDSHKKGQPVLVGTPSIEKSEYLASQLRKHKFTKFQILNALYHEKEAYIISQAGIPGAVTIATNMAGRGTDIQLGGNVAMRIEHELANISDEEIRNKRIKMIQEEVQSLKEKAIVAGGLYVISTERHESRRIDNQLRGRSGRQGDPGRSKFYLSLQDDLMRIFGSPRMESFLRKIGLKEGEAIIHPWINKAIERAQQKVEARNFETRKNLLKYDDVLNEQRKIIFEQRLEIIDTENILEIIADMRHDTLHNIVEKCIPNNSYPEKWDIKKLETEIYEIFGIHFPVLEWRNDNGIDHTEMSKRIFAKADKIAEDQENSFGTEKMQALGRHILLHTLDSFWREHMARLEHSRSIIGFRGYAQRDPLQEYKSEAFGFFNTLLTHLRKDVVSQIARIEPNNINNQELNNSLPYIAENDHGPVIQKENELDTPNVCKTSKIKRNHPCPCGSGKKYKHCHGSYL
ncbi:preprotein translocase subunit SecA [Candidatus Liberibacter asiaticus]|uniref:Protein translocase subunit SecA n=4 Tax=Liberibacter asiaticus TaxID=34021 RepID=C6XHQ7_LIBAP|nr:preprotein translocase subunit SecA [Candidatus Liberibacter asiaticus]ACT56800.1 preprotein translocase subunit SecA [Candidatus Liberibacter asiaticus str. psy62]AGH16567.1 preprotein translocase subunit SecA [Candidatus Liberibacter asiaticus str. gxpsy]ALK06958.1 preprotein translocase subunit SecA [Candidatus Liberibacter asiaticus]ASK52428.1 preprotein translocase subunit SecA [Candidatus Liberibacter asiaticus]AWL13755.1 preprotein translocase subunit SecA [Candidatus Liberibacter as